MRSRRVGSAVAAAVLGAVLMTGCGTPTGGPQPVTGTSAPAPTSAEIRSEPAEVSIPKIGVRSSLVGLGLNADQSVQVPPVSTPLQAGWFTGGPSPGEPGPAVILGHVNGGGRPGVFQRLHELAAGDEVLVRLADGTAVRFVVRRVDQVRKSEFPTDAVYGDTEGTELRLITCGGSYDRAARSYRDNVIVYAAA